MTKRLLQRNRTSFGKAAKTLKNRTERAWLEPLLVSFSAGLEVRPKRAEKTANKHWSEREKMFENLIAMGSDTSQLCFSNVKNCQRRDTDKFSLNWKGQVESTNRSDGLASLASPCNGVIALGIYLALFCQTTFGSG